MKTFLKDPDSTLDYQFDWSDWLDTDTISSYTLDTSGITVESDANTTTAVTVWVSGGTAGSFATIACEIVTAGGRTDERTIKLVIQDR